MSIEFYATFGSKYGHEPHPRFTPAHPDGWLTIEVLGVMPKNLQDREPEMLNRLEVGVRLFLRNILGNAYASLYDTFDGLRPELYKRGELFRISLPWVFFEELVAATEWEAATT